MHLASLLVTALALPSVPARQDGSDGPCHECPQTVWYVDAASLTSGPGTSWTTAFRQLQPAINAAAPGDCIWIAAGVYKPTQTLQRTKTFKIQKALRIYGGFKGDELCLSNRAGDYWNTVLSGDIGQVGLATDNSYTVVTMAGPVPTGQVLEVVLDGLRIVQGNNDSGASPGGGGIHAFTGTLLLQNCFVRRNEALQGGGLFAQGCKVSMRATRFSRNTADDGAGYYASGGETHAFNSTFRKNRARRRGGAVYLEGTDFTAPSLWANVLFEGNQAKRGGALFLQKGESFPPPKPWKPPGRAHLVGCTLTRNSATVAGPACAAIDHPILVGLAGWLEIDNSIIWNNGGPAPQIVGWIGTNVSTSIVPPASPFAQGTNLPLDPLIVPPSYRPQGGSPAIDAGDLSRILPDELDLDDDGDLLEPTPLDWLRRPRVQGAGVDMGATEY